MTFEAKEPHQVPCEQLGIGGAVRCVASLAALDLDRSVLEHEGPLFVSVTFYTRRISGDRVAQGPASETSVLIVAVAAVHRTLWNLVMKWLGD